MVEQGKSVRSPPSGNEEVAEATCGELTTTCVPHPPAHLRGRK